MKTLDYVAAFAAGSFIGLILAFIVIDFGLPFNFNDWTDEQYKIIAAVVGGLYGLFWKWGK